MGKVFDRAKAKARQRKAIKQAMREADPAKVKRLPRGGTGYESVAKRYQRGVEDAMKGYMNGNPNDRAYMDGYRQGRRAEYRSKHCNQGSERFEALMAERRAKQPTPEQVAAQLAAREQADDEARARRQQSGILDALRCS
jgi:hypothetical protein